MKILSFRGEDGSAMLLRAPFPEQAADRGTRVKRVPHTRL